MFRAASRHRRRRMAPQRALPSPLLDAPLLNRGASPVAPCPASILPTLQLHAMGMGDQLTGMSMGPDYSGGDGSGVISLSYPGGSGSGVGGCRHAGACLLFGARRPPRCMLPLCVLPQSRGWSMGSRARAEG